MLLCSFCGSALVIERAEGAEHLLLPHERNDRSAGEALQSYLISRGRAKPDVTEVLFAFKPFLLVEDKEGNTELLPASGKEDLSIPYAPAGNYRFFDEQLAEGEQIIPPDRSGPDGMKTVKILHLPIYTLAYRCGRFEGRASIVGDSWQVMVSDLPAEGQTRDETKNLLALAALITLFLFIGKVASGWAMRFIYIFLSAAAGFAFFRIRERMVSRP